MIIFFKGNEAIKYLEFCIEQLDNKDQAIHNYLLSLYAKLKPDQLMTYLNIQGTVRPPQSLSAIFIPDFIYRNWGLEMFTAFFMLI